MRSGKDRGLCLRGNEKSTQNTKKEPEREAGQHNGMYFTEKKKIDF